MITNISNQPSITDQQFFDFIKKSDTEKLDDITTIKPATLKYLRLFKKHGGNFFLSWNWSAYFTQHIWFFYRRMPLIGLTYTILHIIIRIATRQIFNIPQFDYKIFLDPNWTNVNLPSANLKIFGFISMVSFIGLTMLYNWIYIRQVQNNIMKKQFNQVGVSIKGMWIGIFLAIITVSINIYLEYF